MDKWYTTAVVVTASLALATLGWWFGPPKQKQEKKNNTSPSHSHNYETTDDPCTRKHEEKLRSEMQTLNQYLSVGDLDNAEPLAENILRYTESVWGNRHMNYGLVLGVPMATIYESKGELKKWEEALQTAMSVLIEHGEEFLVDTGIVDKLINCMSLKGNYGKAADYARLLAKVKRETKNRNPDDPEVLLKYGASLTKVGMILSNAGLFKQAESVFNEVIDILSSSDPTSPMIYNCIEYYTNALHQQGKTNEAITKLENYKQKVEPLANSTHIVRKILIRASTLCFAVDQFHKALEFQLAAIKYSNEKSIPLTYQIYAELATLYWELGNETEAKAAQNELKRYTITSPPTQLSQTQPVIRSKYLTTVSCQLREGKYELDLRVNRELPQRREREPLEEVESIKRKLDLCYLDVTFENTQKHQAPVTINVMVTTPHQFKVESPPLQTEEHGWYEVVIVIYEDQKKQKKLGVHHQMIYAFSPTMFFRSPLLS